MVPAAPALPPTRPLLGRCFRETSFEGEAPLIATRARLLPGAPVAALIGAQVATSVDVLAATTGSAPVLATLMVGDDPSASAYRRSIVRSLRTVGIQHRAVDLEREASTRRLGREVRLLNGDDTVTGVLVLMPLPDQIDPQVVFEELSPLKDVDGATPTNAGRLHLGLPALRPSTPQGGVELLDHYGVDLAGRHAVVVGRSNVVGWPLCAILTRRDATVTVCHRQTRGLADFTRRADLVAVAAGHPGLIRGEMIQPGAVVLDFGVNAVDGRLVGDVDLESVAAVADAVTPVPGGTGPVTAMVLARNVVAAGYAALRGTVDESSFTPA